MHKRNSFTLIEFLVGIAIIMLLMTSVANITAQTTIDEATQNRISELIAQLGDEIDSIHRDAAWNLGRITDTKTQSFVKKAVQPLNNALEDEDGHVRKSAAKALTQIKSKVIAQEQVSKESPKEEKQTTQEKPSKEIEKKSTIPGSSTYTQRRIEGFQ